MVITPASERCAGELLEMTSLPEAPTVGGGILALVAAEQGRAGELIDLLTAAMTENPELFVLRTTVAEMNCELGRFDVARAIFDVDKASRFQSATYDITWLSSMTHYVGCAVALDDRDAAAVLLDLVAPFTSLIVVTPADARGSVSRAVGCLEMLLGHDDQAEEHLRHAVEDQHRDAHAILGGPSAAGLCRVPVPGGCVQVMRNAWVSSAAPRATRRPTSATRH